LSDDHVEPLARIVRSLAAPARLDSV